MVQLVWWPLVPPFYDAAYTIARAIDLGCHSVTIKRDGQRKSQLTVTIYQ
jgi:hypothetical protein